MKTSVYFHLSVDGTGERERSIKMEVPAECPMCGEARAWIIVEESNKGFSLGKAAIGAFLLGPIGLLGGALGVRKVACSCGRCGFQHEYDK